MLSQSTSTEDLHLDTYCKPERKDRPTEAHGGILVYIKDNIHSRRRHDLQPRGIECLWIEVENKSKHILFGVFTDHQIQMVSIMGLSKIPFT